VAIENSSRTARRISLIADEGWDLHLFPSNYFPVSPQMRGVTVHQSWIQLRPWAMLKVLIEIPGAWVRHRLDPQMRERTQNLYHDHNERLGAFLGRDLSHWNNGAPLTGHANGSR
jgi:hypothetical protein